MAKKPKPTHPPQPGPAPPPAPPPPVPVAVSLVWGQVEGAESYVLQIGPASGTYTMFDQNVGWTRLCVLLLAPGRYYVRIVAMAGGIPITAPQEWVCAV